MDQLHLFQDRRLAALSSACVSCRGAEVSRFHSAPCAGFQLTEQQQLHLLRHALLVLPDQPLDLAVPFRLDVGGSGAHAHGDEEASQIGCTDAFLLSGSNPGGGGAGVRQGEVVVVIVVVEVVVQGEVEVGVEVGVVFAADRGRRLTLK